MIGCEYLDEDILIAVQLFIEIEPARIHKTDLQRFDGRASAAVCGWLVGSNDDGRDVSSVIEPLIGKLKVEDSVTTLHSKSSLIDASGVQR